jgi:hypothetical protein
MNRLLFIFLFCSGICYCQEYTGEFVLTSRWFRPLSKNDTLDTFKAIKDFKPSRLEWLYSTDSVNCSKLSIPFSLTINPMTPDSNGFTTQENRIKTVYNDVYVAPWMKTWKIKTPYWGCVNSSSFQKLFLKHSIDIVKLGPYAIMIDNPEMNSRLISDRLAGCFCDHCINKYFRYNLFNKKKNKSKLVFEVIKYNQDSTKSYPKSKIQLDYEEFQMNSVNKFYKVWKRKILIFNPELKIFGNNYNGEWPFYFMNFDGGIAEITENNINDKKLDQLYQLADSLNKKQLFNSNSSNEEFHKKLLIYNLKNNRDILIPWDLYIKNSNKRYYMPIELFNEICNEYNKK